MVTSQLGHYSKLFGPQILLQLNLAFYLPSIPVLLLSGSLERLLDARLGTMGSIAARLHAGLAGCLALAALFPLLPGLRPGDGPLWPLLGCVGLLGGLSAVAFSTGYQLVQFFRAADTIGLGVGCVGSGPLVLLVQIALGVGPSPARWQWIAMYEVSAGFIALGLFSSASLCAQYWPRLTAATRGAAAAAAADGGGAAADGGDGRVPLLSAADVGCEDEEAGGGVGGWGTAASPMAVQQHPGSPASPGGMRPHGSAGLRVRSRRLTRRPTTAPDPFNVFSVLTPGLDGGFDWAGDGDDGDDSGPPVLLRRAMSAGEERAAAAARRRQALAAVGLDRSQGGALRTGPQHYVSSLHAGRPGGPSPPSPEPTTPAAGAAAATGPTAGPNGLPGMLSAPPAMRHAPPQPPQPPTASNGGKSSGSGSGHGNEARDENRSSLFRGVLDLEFGVPDAEPPHVTEGGGAAATGSDGVDGAGGTASGGVAYDHGLGGLTVDSANAAGGQSEVPRTGTYASAFASAAASRPVAAALRAAEAGRAPAAATDAGTGVCVYDDGAGEVAAEAALGAEVEATPLVGADDKAEAEGPARCLTVQEEVAEVVRGCWQVLLGFLISVTVLYVVFPFFTYVPTSGWLGDSLPQVLFYARLFTDLAGRLLPRRRSLQLRSGGAVLALAAATAAAAGLFFAYILAPPRAVAAAPRLLRNDAVPLTLVVFLWLAGGYTNTMSNMLAPSLAAPDLAGRASALMALLFNVGHIGGLVLAAAGAAAVFGDVVG